LAGVTSFGNASCLPTDDAHYANVSFDRDFIEAKAGADLGRSTCVNLPGAGSVGAPYFFDVDTLSASDTSDVFSILVPVGTSSLRIALNGTAEGLPDFDLYVRRGSPPVASSAD